MDLKEVFGLEPKKKVRYAVVGAGDIAQEDMMPGVKHTGNSEITVLVTSDPEKAVSLTEKYHLQATYNYDHFEGALR